MKTLLIICITLALLVTVGLSITLHQEQQNHDLQCGRMQTLLNVARIHLNADHRVQNANQTNP